MGFWRGKCENVEMQLKALELVGGCICCNGTGNRSGNGSCLKRSGRKGITGRNIVRRFEGRIFWKRICRTFSFYLKKENFISLR
jgi:hypothetical protein